VFIVLHFPECHIAGILQFIAFKMDLFQFLPGIEGMVGEREGAE
jgi:hypothetical protein